MRGALPFGALLVAVLATATRARAENIVVNLTSDEADADPADGTPDVDLATAGLQVTLRSALQHANQTAGRDAIDFAVNGSIAPASPLPEVLEEIRIDGAIPAGKLRLQGQGLVLRAPSCSISKLVIDSAPIDAITSHDPGELLLADVELVSSVAGLGVRARGLVSITSALVSGNALGGVLSAEGHVIGAHLTVESNGGPGVIARDGIRIVADVGFPNRIRANGGGLYSDGAIELGGPGMHEISGNFGDGVRTLSTMIADGEVEIVDNASFGVRAYGEVALGRTAVVSGNGHGFAMVVPNAIEFELALLVVPGDQIQGGGAFSATGGLHGGQLTATDNGGPALLGGFDVAFEHVTLVRNDGDGIQNDGFVFLDSGEIEGNAGFGINAAEAVFLDGGFRFANNAGSAVSTYVLQISGTAQTVIESNGKLERARTARFDDTLHVELSSTEPLRDGIFATTVEAFNLEIVDSGGDGIHAWYVDLTDATVSNNAGAGVRMFHGTFLRTVVCDNAGGDLDLNGELDFEVTLICDRANGDEAGGCSCSATHGQRDSMLSLLLLGLLCLRRKHLSKRFGR